MGDDTTLPTPAPDPTPAPASNVKPGWKTTEFWLSKIAVVVGALLASGVITDERWLRALGLVGAVVSALGYTAARTMVKNAAVLLILVIGLSTLTTSTGCRSIPPQVTHVIEDCINQQRGDVISLIVKWNKDKPSWSDIVAQALSAGAHVGGCAIHEFVNTYLTPASGNHAVDPDQAWQAHAALALFEKEAKISDNVTFKTPQGNL